MSMNENQYSILYLTDFFYEAKGRNYYEEDLYIISQLKEDFDIVMCQPTHSRKFEDMADVIVFRNTGSVLYYKSYFDEFVNRVNSRGITTYNTMNGQGDMKGKQHLIDLTRDGFPVIQTVDDMANIDQLPQADQYLLKLKNGADSIGMKVVPRNELDDHDLSGYVIQPYLDFEYEVSFYFIDDAFQYALYAPNKEKRWELSEYSPSAKDLAFAKKFVDWNTITSGIQRVDACRLNSGELLLVELEDLNPYLSLELVGDVMKQKFIGSLKESILKLIDKNQ